MTTISCTFLRAGLYERVARKKPLLTEKFTKRHEGLLLNTWKVLQSDETKIKLIGHQEKCYMWCNPSVSLHPKNTMIHSGYSIHAVGVFFISRVLETGQN